MNKNKLTISKKLASAMTDREECREAALTADTDDERDVRDVIQEWMISEK